MQDGSSCAGREFLCRTGVPVQDGSSCAGAGVPARRSGPPAHSMSRTKVNGPSLVSSTRIIAPNRPSATVAPRSRRRVATADTSGSAWSRPEAWSQVGRRPLRIAPYSVNWLTTSSGRSRSDADSSRGPPGGRPAAGETFAEGLLVEDPQLVDLVGKTVRLVDRVGVGDAHEDAQPRSVDLTDDLPVDGDPGTVHALHDSPHSPASRPRRPWNPLIPRHHGAGGVRGRRRPAGWPRPTRPHR